MERINMVTETCREKRPEVEVDVTKREFMKKFGRYAATAPLGMYLLMGPGASKAQASGSCVVNGTFHHWGVDQDKNGNEWTVKAQNLSSQKIHTFKTDGSTYYHTTPSGKTNKYTDVNTFKNDMEPGSTLYELLECLGFWS
jgi:hypothetical protein